MEKLKKLIIVGAGGQGEVIMDIALKNEYQIMGFLDDNPDKQEVAGCPILGKFTDYKKYVDKAEFVLATGSNQLRNQLDSIMEDANWATLIHPTAIIGVGVNIKEGTVVMARAVINPFAQIGRHNIINTAALVEHDNKLSDFVHIAPNAAMAGNVVVKERTLIGMSSAIRNNLTIAEDTIIGAGAVVVKSISEPGGVYVGIPARKLR